MQCYFSLKDQNLLIQAESSGGKIQTPESEQQAAERNDPCTPWRSEMHDRCKLYSHYGVWHAGQLRTCLSGHFLTEIDA